MFCEFPHSSGVFALADHDQKYGSTCIQKTEIKDLALYRYCWSGAIGEMCLDMSCI